VETVYEPRYRSEFVGEGTMTQPNYAYLTPEDRKEILVLQLVNETHDYLTLHERLILRMEEEIHFLQEKLRD
jgi:hypothetical protein